MLSAADIMSGLNRKSIAPFLLPELLRAHSNLLIRNGEVLNLTLRTLATMTWDQAEAWRLDAASRVPELKPNLAAATQTGNSRQRYQAEQLIRAIAAVKGNTGA
jgi:hypothetical protein